MRMTDLPKDFVGLSTGRPEELGLSPAALDRLVAVMEREIAAGKAPGVSMMIARRGRVGFLQTLGALRPGGPAMPLDAIFRIYSMTKPITSLAAMMLVEEGRLLLNEPVAKYIPAFADVKVGVERGGELELVRP
jgi:CubicO group peptidase (beta-lactamase class C family)